MPIMMKNRVLGGKPGTSHVKAGQSETGPKRQAMG